MFTIRRVLLVAVTTVMLIASASCGSTSVLASHSNPRAIDGLQSQLKQLQESVRHLRQEITLRDLQEEIESLQMETGSESKGMRETIHIQNDTVAIDSADEAEAPRPSRKRLTKKENGVTCYENTQCTSGLCQNGVCTKFY